MKERPILMSGPLVVAALDGRKTMTRRIVNLDKLRVRLPREVRSDPVGIPWLDDAPLVAPPGTYRAQMNPHGAVSIDVGGRWLGVKPGEFHFVCPYADGDTHLGNYGGERQLWTVTPRDSRLWVREAWEDPADFCPWHQTSVLGAPCWCSDRTKVNYRATPDRGDDNRRWRPSIHMPRWACRLLLDVTAVRVERLHDIAEEDARAEGVGMRELHDWPGSSDRYYGDEGGAANYRRSFALLWGQINGVESWQANPWCWCITFRRVVEERAA